MNNKFDDKIPGADKFLYNFHYLKDGIKIKSIKVIAFTKFAAYIDTRELVKEEWNSYDYDYIRPAEDNEECGIFVKTNL